MKKIISVLFCMAMLLWLVACGESDAAISVSLEQANTDAQEYLSMFISENAEITTFSQESSQEKDTGLELWYLAEYTDNGEYKHATFIMTYQKDGRNWELNDCRVDLDGTLNGVNQDELITGSPEIANGVAEEFAGIQTDIDWDSDLLDDWDEQHETVYPESVNGVSTLEDIFEIYKFKLNGSSYSLPCDLQEFLDAGWGNSLYDLTADTLDARAYSALVLYSGNAQFDLVIANLEETAIPINRCIVIEVSVASSWGVEFETAKGLKLGDTADLATNLYGDETYSSDESGVEYCYLRQLGFQQNMSGIMRENTQDDALNIQWKDGTVNYISMKLIYEE